MGTWYVQRQVPAVSALEAGAHNGKEVYSYDEKTKSVTVKYTYQKGSFNAKTSTVWQKGKFASELDT